MKSIASVLSIIVLGVGLLSCSGDEGSSSTAFLYVSNSGEPTSLPTGLIQALVYSHLLPVRRSLQKSILRA